VGERMRIQVPRAIAYVCTSDPGPTHNALGAEGLTFYEAQAMAARSNAWPEMRKRLEDVLLKIERRQGADWAEVGRIAEEMADPRFGVGPEPE